MSDPSTGWSDFLADQPKAGWYLSRRGNWTRTWSGLRLTVFEGNGGHRWSIADGAKVRYSPTSYRTGLLAMQAAMQEARRLIDDN